MHKNTKYWAFTWDTNVKQKKLPELGNLKKFLDIISETCTFQLESGTVKGKLHYQGVLTLVGPRQSKKQVLELFKNRFRNVAGLTLSKVYDKEAIMRYVTKEETRVKGPFFAGCQEKYTEKFMSADLHPWQKDLFDFIKEKSTDKIFRDRKIIWLEDQIGNTGKSFFQKWLRLGQRDIICRKLPESTVERLISATVKLFSKQEVDLVMIDLTRTAGKEQSLDDMFSAIENIKNGFIVDTLYGNYTEAIFEPPLVLIFTNKKHSDYSKKLSEDRWFILSMNSDRQIEHRVCNIDSTVTPIFLKNLTNKKKKNKGAGTPFSKN